MNPTLQLEDLLDAAAGQGKQSDRLADQAYRAIEEKIITLQLEPGSVWSEAVLSDLVGIGRTPVREAVQKLANDHLVVIHRRHGIMISEVNAHQQLLVLETRQELDRLLASRAARRANADERKVMIQVAEEMKSTGSKGHIISFLRWYFAGKKYVSKCARNPFAAAAVAPLHTLSRRFYFIHYEELDNLLEVSELHAAVMYAVAHGDEKRAAEASDRHIEFAMDFTKRILTEHF